MVLVSLVNYIPTQQVPVIGGLVSTPNSRFLEENIKWKASGEGSFLDSNNRVYILHPYYSPAQTGGNGETDLGLLLVPGPFYKGQPGTHPRKTGT